jgi:hypothetical protein
MGHAGAEQIAFVVQEHLRFVDQAPKGRRVDDAVSVSLKVISRRGGRFKKATTARAGWLTGENGKGHGRGSEKGKAGFKLGNKRR